MTAGQQGRGLAHPLLKAAHLRIRGWTVSRILGGVFALAALLAVLLLARTAFSFLVFHAVDPRSQGVEACREADGACWPFVAAKLRQFIVGHYPDGMIARAILAMAMPPLAIAAAFLLKHRLGLLGFAGAVLMSLPLAFIALAGDGYLLPSVGTELWGGLTLTLMVSYTGIAASLPLGLLLALGRRSSWPVPRWLAICAIEFWRGVPLVTVLFMASVMLPLFLPEGVSVNKLARALVAIALFASAYMAEVIRGGLQSVPATQYESAEALGFHYAQTLALVILPQALRNALPGIVGTFIGLLKDTTLVLVIGLFDFLGMVQLAAADPAWSAPSTAITGYVFAALVFWCLCFGISRAGAALERGAVRGRQ
jgi:general L-amino acid transport system permease protein